MSDLPRQCPSCGGACGYTESKGCQYISSTIPIDSLRARWDAKAAPQLRAELERIQAALKNAEDRAERAEREAQHWMEVADGWRDDLLAEFERNDKQAGLTKDGHLVAV